MVDLDEMEAAQQLRQRLRALSARTQASIARSREIANAAWVRIRASRRRIFAHLAIAGGSAARDDMPADALHAQIRAQVASGSLPRIDGAAWAGLGEGDRECACCHQLIRARAPQYEPRDHPLLYAHLHCFALWREISDGEAAAAS